MCYFLKAGGYRISIMIIISSSHLHLHPQSVLYFLNIKYDIPVCHEGYEGHEGHEVYDGHIFICGHHKHLYLQIDGIYP